MPSTEGLVLQLLPKSGLGGHCPDDAVQSFSTETQRTFCETDAQLATHDRRFRLGTAIRVYARRSSG
jgi:hypothetical protein